MILEAKRQTMIPEAIKNLQIDGDSQSILHVHRYHRETKMKREDKSCKDKCRLPHRCTKSYRRLQIIKHAHKYNANKMRK